MSALPRRSTRGSTPTGAASPPPSRNNTRSSVLPNSASTPSLSSLVPPPSPGGPLRQSRALSPRVAAKMDRPKLPLDKANKLMVDSGAAKAQKVHKVKTQTLHLGENSGTITIARVKCPVPKGVPGHIIKRFDTNAISASSLFRAAFPTATADEEAIEMRWVAVGSRGKYGDTAIAGMEHDESKKLSGTWVPASYALFLADEYGVQRFATELVAYQEEGVAQPDTPSAAGTEAEDSPALRSPRSKRARVSSPLADRSTRSSAQALSGATGPGISILQTLERTDSGTVTETTQVNIDVPVPTNQDGDALPTFDEAGEAQVAAAKKLVEDLKENGTLQQMSESTHIPEPASSSASKKRGLEEEDDEEEQEDEEAASSAVSEKLVDNRSFFSKLFRRKQNSSGSRKRKAIQAAASTAQEEVEQRLLRALPASRQAPEIVVREEGENGEGRRWAAGFGLAVAVGATAAAPYLFG